MEDYDKKKILLRRGKRKSRKGKLIKRQNITIETALKSWRSTLRGKQGGKCFSQAKKGIVNRPYMKIWNDDFISAVIIQIIPNDFG